MATSMPMMQGVETGVPQLKFQREVVPTVLQR